MRKTMQSYANIDEYLANFEGETLKKLQIIRKIVKDLVPEAQEKISYGIPTFTLNGNLLHFAGYSTHIGFYPGALPIHELAKELIGYNTSKGTVQFPLNKPLPVKLISDMTALCVERNKTKRRK